MARCRPCGPKAGRNHQPGIFGSQAPSVSVSLTDSITLSESLTFSGQVGLTDSITLSESLTLDVTANCTTLFRVPSRQISFKVPIPRIY